MQNNHAMSALDSANIELKISKKSFATSMCLLGAVVLLVGILTYIIPPSLFQLDGAGKILPDTWTLIDPSETDRLPIWRWPTAPIEALLFANGNEIIIQVCFLLVALGGSFYIIEGTGGMNAMITQLISTFRHRKYLGLCAVTFALTLLGAFYGLQEQLLVLMPIIMGLCIAMKWDNVVAIAIILLGSAVGFTVSISNPFTIGLASTTIGTDMFDGVWYRVVLLLLFSVVTMTILVLMAKRSEKKLMAQSAILDSSTLDDNIANTITASPETKRIATMYISLFLGVLAVIIISSSIPALKKLTMILMAVAFIVGTLVMGTVINKDIKTTLKQFGRGALALSPGTLILMLAYTVKYLAEEAMIIDTIVHYLFGLLVGQNVFVVIILLFFSILIMEFFIPAATSKVVIIMPILASLPLESMGLSNQLIILIFMFADGFTNIFFPTCGTLVIGLSLAKVSFGEWYKRTWPFHLIVLAMSLGSLFVAQLIGY